MPAKKIIYDIAPPQKKTEVLLPEKPKIHAAKKTVSGPEVALEPVSSRRKLILVLIGAALFLGGILSYFFISPKLKIEVWPEQEVFNEMVTTTVSVAKKSGNYIPGEIIKSEKIISQDFTAQGRAVKAVRAQGTIRVYNNYSTAPQTLLASTRFVSSEGKLFRTPSRVVIPGGRYEGSKLVAGSIDITVVADEAGEDYNIGPSTFSIPGFAGTSKYTVFYGKSSEAMTGGLKKEVARVTQEDLDKAKEILIQKATAEGTALVKNSGGYVILDEAVTIEVSGFQSTVTAGQDSETFSAQVTLRGQALAYKESDFNDFIKNYIEDKLISEKKLIDSSLKAERSLRSIDLAKSEFSLILAVSARIYPTLEESQVKTAIKGKKARDIEMIIRNFPQIKKAKAELWPFWANSAPDNLQDIKVVLRLD